MQIDRHEKIEYYHTKNSLGKGCLVYLEEIRGSGMLMAKQPGNSTNKGLYIDKINYERSRMTV